VVTTASDIDSFIRTQREAAQVSVRQLAERRQIERGLHKPTADVLNQIAKALPESAGAIRGAGILEPTETSAARDAIITDTTITKRRKQVLFDIYSSLRRQNENAREKPATA
jgi:transcriptional regulator with XRE-family HTH domain